MKRSILVGLGVLAGVVLLLGALDVIPLGLGGGGGARDPGASDLLHAGDEEGEHAATLEGLGRGKDAAARTPAAPAPEVEVVPAEVHGGTPGGASVRGRVVRAKGHVPFPGVKVTLTRPDSMVAYLRAKANGRFDDLEARTGADGRFAFLDVTPSKGYVVRARHEGFAAASTPEALDLSGRGSVDVGDLVLGPGATITARVLDAERRPAPNVRVVATWRISNRLGVILADPATAPEIEAEARTGSDGRFTLARLDPQPTTLLVMAPSGAAQVVPEVTLEAGAVKSLEDIVLPPDRHLAGTVTWKDGTPVTDARLFAAPQMQTGVRTTATDAQGRFRLGWLPEGDNYVLGVLVPGLPAKLVMGLHLGQDDVSVQLPMPGSLRGTVRAASGAPVQRFGLELEPSQPPSDFMARMVGTQVRRALGPTPFVDPQGTFDVPRVQAGSYTVRVSAPGFPTVERKGVVVTGGETTELHVEVPRGNVARGVVRRANGDPVEGARLFVVEDALAQDVEPTALAGYVHNRDPDAVSRGDGSFELPPQTPGRYDVIASRPDLLPGIAHRVDLGSGDVGDVRIQLPPSGSVRGVLLDQSGRPAPGERVFVLFRSGILRLEQTDAKGRFEAKGLPVGRCLVRWASFGATRVYNRLIRGGDPAKRDRGYDELRRDGEEHEVVDGGTLEVSLRLPPRTRVSGHYRIAGQPPPEKKRTFYVTVQGGGTWVRVDVDADGAFETRLEGGTYVVYGPSSEDFEVKTIVVPEATSQVIDIDMD